MKNFITFVLLSFVIVAKAADGVPDFFNPSNTMGFYYGTGTTCMVSPWSTETKDYVCAYTNPSYVIPETVYDSKTNKTYTVTGIAFGAFSESPTTSVSIPATVSVIEDYAFEKCFKLKTITNLSTTPQSVNNDTFRKLDDTALASIKLYVPAGCSAIYKAAPKWGKMDIEEISSSDIKIIEKTSKDSPTYNMNGQRVDKVKSGIYVKNKRKIFIK